MNLKENTKLISQPWFAILVPYLLLVIVHILLGLPMKLPTIYPDEHAYLAYAKFFAGLGVTEVFKGDLLGSFGYSFLIAPVFILFKNPISSYQAVIVINSFIAPTLYIVAYLFLRKVINLEKKYSIIFAILLCFYPAYLLQSNAAYTESLTPTLFLLSVITFWNFINKQNYLWAFIYSIVLGFFFSVHIRIAPTIIISIFYLGFLTYRKIIDKKIGIITIIFQIVLFLIIYYIGHSITNLFTPEFQASYRIVERIISQIDMVLLFAILFFTWFFAVRRKFLQLAILYFSSIAGILFEIKFLSISILALICITLFILIIIRKISIKEFSFLIVSSAFLFVISLIVIPEIKFLGSSFQMIYYWLVNSIGMLYYLSTATYGLFIIGVLYLIFTILINKQQIGAYFKSNINLILLFVALLSFSMLFVTVTPRQMLAYEGRADHIFYGRYSEVFLPIYLLLGILAFKKQEKLNYKSLFIFSFLIFIFFFTILVFNYGNIIPSELAFQSVLSFFPYRAVLGNINLALFSLSTLIILAIFSFLSLKKNFLGSVFLFLVFLSFSIFTYYYTFYYYQRDVQNRTTLVSKILLLKQYCNVLNVDTKYPMNSNVYNYSYILPDISFLYTQPSEITDSSCLVLSEPNLKSLFGDKALPIASENDGNDFLWALPGPNYDSITNKYLPSYLNINIIDTNLIGFKRVGFYKDFWINGKVLIRIPLKKTDSIRAIEFKISSNNPNPQNLIIWFNNKEIFNQNIEKGAWQYNLNVQLSKGANFHEIKFFSDLIQKNQDLIQGIQLLELKFISDEDNIQQNYVYKEQTKFFNFLQPTPYFIKIRDNYKIHNTILRSKEKIIIPIDIINLDFEERTISSKENIYINYRWREFVFRKIKYEGNPIPIIEKMNPGEKRSYFLEIVAPEKQGKYFLEFDLKSKDKDLWLDKNSLFTPRYIVLIK